MTGAGCERMSEIVNNSEKHIGSKLIRGALDQVRTDRLKLIAVPVREGIYRQESGLSGSAEVSST
jgi:hypothetical protein